MAHPITAFLMSVFSDKPVEQVNRWAQYLIEQRFRTVAALKDVTSQEWEMMEPDIPFYVSEIIIKRVNEKLQGTREGSFFQKGPGIFSVQRNE